MHNGVPLRDDVQAPSRTFHRTPAIPHLSIPPTQPTNTTGYRHSNDEQFKDIFFAKIDVDDLPELSQELGIRAMPTFMIFKDGEKADELVGANPNALVQLLQKSK